MIDKEKITEKWNSIMGKVTTENVTDLTSIHNKYPNIVQDEISEPSDSIINDFSDLMFPMVRRVFASTLSGGGSRKSNIQQLKENRINKLRLLEGKKPNVVLPDDVHYDGLVSVTPTTMPSGQIFYMDFKYDPIGIIKRDRKSKLDKINISFRKDKLEYIEKTIKQNG